MQASRIRFSAAHLFYAATLTAAATALFSHMGLPVAAFVLLVWWQVLSGARRETQAAAGEQMTSEARLRQRTVNLTGVVPERRTGVSRIEVLIVVLVVGLLVGLLLPATTDADPMRHAEISLKMIAKAIQQYEQAHGGLPPAIVCDTTGQPLHSWRALILPYLGEDQLAAAYRFDEPWNGPHNALLAQYRPWHFRPYFPEHDFDEVTTAVQVLPHGTSWLLLEHEELHSHWLEPSSLPANALEYFEHVPEVGHGFWQRGFFASRHRGRLIVAPSNSWWVHPTPAATIQQELAAAHHVGDELVIGRGVTRLHVAQVFRLGCFLLVALYPIRWLRGIRVGGRS